MVETTGYQQTDSGLFVPEKSKAMSYAPAPISLSFGDLSAASFGYPDTYVKDFDGDKFFGGFGTTSIFQTDYWMLRARSTQLFQENLYARGLIRRLITNEINTGLTLEATPNSTLVGKSDDELNDWSEDVETRFGVWAANPDLCDYALQDTFGGVQREARLEALISGDVLVVLRNSRVTGLPMVQLISGEKIRTPIDAKPRRGHKIVHGVELDSNNRQVAYWVMQENQTSKRMPTIGEKSGRRIAWLVYGTDKRLDDVRGQPILSLVLQSLKEIDRMRDAEQRAAVINASLAMFIKKGENKMGSLPMTGGAARRDSLSVTSDGSTRTLNLHGHIPGMVMEELQYGEEPQSFDTTRPNLNFNGFEAAILGAIAWACEIPPEIMMLQFNNNYSASRAAVNEFKLYLNKERSKFADNFHKPIYVEWLLSEALLGKINAPGLIESWRDPRKYDVFGGWISSDWGGAIKPSVDLAKEVKGYTDMINQGLITRDRAAKELTGTKFSTNAKRLAKENEMLGEAKRPTLELQNEFAGSVEDASDTQNEFEDSLETLVRGYIDDANEQTTTIT
jgi:lambda family phage portal protein